MVQKFLASVQDADTIKVGVQISMTIAEWKKIRDAIEPNTSQAAQTFFYTLRDIIDLTDVEIKKVIE